MLHQPAIEFIGTDPLQRKPGQEFKRKLPPVEEIRDVAAISVEVVDRGGSSDGSPKEARSDKSRQAKASTEAKATPGGARKYRFGCRMSNTSRREGTPSTRRLKTENILIPRVTPGARSVRRSMPPACMRAAKRKRASPCRSVGDSNERSEFTSSAEGGGSRRISPGTSHR